MSTLEQLFPDGKHRVDASAAADDRQTVRRLDALFGDRRADLDRTHRASARPALVAMVNDAVAGAMPLGSMPSTGRSVGSRSRRRVDVINAVAASLAVIALAVAGTVAGVQVASARPATDALRVLSIDEKTIESASTGLDAARTRLAQTIAAADAGAEAMRPILDAQREAAPTELQVASSSDMIPIADAAAVDAVLGAVDAYRKDLAAFDVPEMPAEYARGDIDTESLTAVGSAIDAVQLKLAEIDRVSAAVRTLRTAVDARKAAFAAQLKTFTATFPTSAQNAIDNHRDAAQNLKDAVTKSAAAVAAADLQVDGAPRLLSAYRDAVVALVADQVRVDVRQESQERMERERTERERRGRRSAPRLTDPAPNEPSTPRSDPTAPSYPTEPSDPTEPTDANVPPDLTEPPADFAGD